MKCQLILLLSAALLSTSAGLAQEADDWNDFKPIFDGKSLENWDFDPAFWRVEDGAITGESTPENPVKYNTFCTWKGGDLDDFELKLEFKLTSEKGGNSGIQVRSFRLPDEDGKKKWRIGGYQADFESGPKFSGIVYGEASAASFLSAVRKRKSSAKATPSKRTLLAPSVIRRLLAASSKTVNGTNTTSPARATR